MPQFAHSGMNEQYIESAQMLSSVKLLVLVPPSPPPGNKISWNAGDKYLTNIC